MDYISDDILGFRVAATNLPAAKVPALGPAPVAPAPVTPVVVSPPAPKVVSAYVAPATYETVQPVVAAPIAPAVVSPPVTTAYVPGTAYVNPLTYASRYAYPEITYAPSPITASQYHAQNEFGEYNYGYSNINSAKSELKSADGVTRGSYSYVDANGVLQRVDYIADDLFGFRVAATNLPQAPAPVPAPVVVAQE